MLTFQEVNQYSSELSVRQNNDLYSLADESFLSFYVIPFFKILILLVKHFPFYSKGFQVEGLIIFSSKAI